MTMTRERECTKRGFAERKRDFSELCDSFIFPDLEDEKKLMKEALPRSRRFFINLKGQQSLFGKSLGWALAFSVVGDG